MWKEKSSTERSCGGKRLLMVGDKDRLLQRNCDLRKRGKRVRDSWRDFGLNLSIFIQIVNL